MNADELESLLQASPCETDATAADRLRATRFARFGVLAAPASGEEARSASETISAALARRPPRVTATEWGAALHKAESFWHGALRPRAEKFLSLPVGPRLRYHVWGETDDPDVVDVVLLHDLYPDGLVALDKARSDAWWVRIWMRLNRAALGRAERVITLGRDMSRHCHDVYQVSQERQAGHYARAVSPQLGAGFVLAGRLALQTTRQNHGGPTPPPEKSRHRRQSQRHR